MVYMSASKDTYRHIGRIIHLINWCMYKKWKCQLVLHRFSSVPSNACNLLQISTYFRHICNKHTKTIFVCWVWEDLWNENCTYTLKKRGQQIKKGELGTGTSQSVWKLHVHISYFHFLGLPLWLQLQILANAPLMNTQTWQPLIKNKLSYFIKLLTFIFKLTP